MKFAIIEKTTGFLKEKKPEILLAIGIAGVVVSTVKACQAARKLDPIIDESKAKIDAIHKNAEAGEKKDFKTGEIVPYTPKEASKDTAVVWVQLGGKMVKTFGPAVTLGVVSIACILESYKALHNENVKLAAKCAALKEGYDDLKELFDARNKQFKEYRQEVKNLFGDEADEKIYLKTETKEIKETVTDENGKKKVIKKPVQVVDRAAESPYMKIFDRSNKYWDEGHDSEVYMDMFFKERMAFLNDRLNVNEIVPLNEAYEAYGFKMDRNKGLKCGWDKRNPNGDGYIEITVTKVYIKNDLGEYEKAYAIDFNVDGCIADDE